MSGNLFVISGPSGVGKDSLMALVFDSCPSLYRWVTCTTRCPRQGEKEGMDYFFKTKDEFKKMINTNDLVEWNKFAGNYYGTPKKFVTDKLSENKNIITVIDVNGAENVKKYFPCAHLIFIQPPNMHELKDRLIKRGTESMDYIEKRLSVVGSEIDKQDQFDVVFVNDNLNNCAKKIICYINKYIDDKN